MSDNGKNNIRQAITIVITSVSTALIMSLIAPNGLRNAVRSVEIQQATTKLQVDLNTNRLAILEFERSKLVTKEDLQLMKNDLLRELKK